MTSKTGRASIALSLFFVLGIASACGGGDPSVPSELPLELGTGEASFEPLTDGQELDLIAGSQGGHHVWVSLRTEGIADGRVMMRIDYEPADGTGSPVVSEVPVLMDRDEASGEAELVGWPAVIARPGCVVDTMISLRVQIEDQRGARGFDERVIMVLGGSEPPDGCD